MAELVLPVAFWNGPPTHSITCLLVSPDKTTLVTGGSNGNLCLWTLRYKGNKSNSAASLKEILQEDKEKAEKISDSSKPRISLKCVLVGHKTAVTALTAATYDWKECVISVSIDGTLCIWNFSDGRCLACVEELLMPYPTCITLLPSGTHIATCGRHYYIEVVSLKKLKISNKFLGHTNWVTSLYACDLSPTQQVHSPMLISAGMDGIIQFWSLRKNDGGLPVQTFCFDIGTPLSVALSPDFKTLLVVSQQEFVIYTAKDSREVLSVPCPDPGGWKGGSYMNSRSVIVYSKEGNAYLYTIPRLEKAALLSFATMDMPKQPTKMNSLVEISIGNEEEDIDVENPKQQPANWRASLLSKLNIIDKNKTGVQPLAIFARNSQENDENASYLSHVGGVWGRVLVTGNRIGRVSVWIIPSQVDKLDMESRVLPWAVSTPDYQWYKPTFPTPGSLEESLSPNNQKENREKYKQVTASMIVEDLLLLILGYENGQLCIFPLPSGNKEIAHQKAHNGPVTSLMSVPAAGRLHRLVSGGRDATVKVWSTRKDGYLELLGTFVNHTATVTQIFQPPLTGLGQAEKEFWANCFFSISKDKTIGLYSLENMNCKHIFGAHANYILHVNWNLEQDYLIVQCEDGSVSIWELGTGQLDSTVYGEATIDIMKMTKSILPDIEENFNEKVLKKSMTAFTINMKDDLPIQLLYLNIKNLVFDLGLHLRILDPETNGKQTTESLVESNALPTKIQQVSNGQEFANLQIPPTSLSAYAVFTYLLPWGMNTDMDQLCMSQLQLQPPVPEISFAIKGYGGKLAIWVPSALELGRWQCSDSLTAQHTLSAVTYTKSLMSLEYFRNTCAQLLSYYCTLIPETLANYAPPSLSILALYWRDPIDDVLQAARTIFVATADRLSSEQRRSFASSWAPKLKKDSEKDSKSLAIIVLAILGSQWPDSMDKDLTAQVTNELLKLLNSDTEGGALRIASVELLGKGFSIWRNYIKDVDLLIQQLFSLSLLSDPPNISNTAHHALMLIGAAEPKQFVISLGQYILEVHSDNLNGKPLNISQHSAAIMTLGSLIKQDPISLLPLLPRLVETVVRSLDPHVPYLRDSCLQATTKVLHALVKQYPMVSFHQESQRLAVGTQDAVIVIYDLKTATRCHLLEGHRGGISAVSFASTGKMLASYSIVDSEVKFWQTSGTFLGFLGYSPHCIRTCTVNRVDRNLSQINLLESIRLKWTSPQEVTLIRAWEPNVIFHSKNTMPK